MKRDQVISGYNHYAKIFEVMKATENKHHNYVGGLKDHTMATLLMAIWYIETSPDSVKMIINKDDLLTSIVFHDFDKLDDFETHSDVVEWLEEIGLSSSDIREGILHSHGGWARQEYNYEPYSMNGIIINYVDMISTQVITDKTKTIVSIEDFFNKIEDIKLRS
jgi:hypothetical protein